MEGWADRSPSDTSRCWRRCCVLLPLATAPPEERSSSPAVTLRCSPDPCLAPLGRLLFALGRHYASPPELTPPLRATPQERPQARGSGRATKMAKLRCPSQG